MTSDMTYEQVMQRAQVDALYAEYTAALDDRRYDDWIELFVDECSYIVQPRENFDAGLPLATIRLGSKAMLKDRIYGVTRTLVHEPYYQRHLVSGLRIVVQENADVIEVGASYLVIRTHADRPSEVFSAGRYDDRLIRENETLRFVQKTCVFDSELIANSLIYPI